MKSSGKYFYSFAFYECFWFSISSQLLISKSLVLLITLIETNLIWKGLWYLSFQT